MNVRNEIKAQIIRAGMTMQEVVDLLSDEYGWSDSVSNLSAKLQRKASDTRKYWSLPMCWDATLYGSKDGSDAPGNSPSHLLVPIGTPQCCLWMAVKRCQRLQETFRRTASCRRADHGKKLQTFCLVSRGHRSDRTPPRESPRHFAARMDESVIVGYYTSAEVHPRSPARLLLSKERKKPMARNDGMTVPFAS